MRIFATPALPALAALLRSSAFRNNGVLFLTWDDADKASPGNQVATLVISPGAKTAYRSAASYNHYSLLRTIEDLLSIAPLGASAQAKPMADFFESGFFSNLPLNLVPHSSGAPPQPSTTP